NTIVTIEPGNNTILQVNIYNILGHRVMNAPSPGPTGFIQLPTYALANGIYFIQIRTTGTVFVERLVVQN
ncbi:MAG TPA: T9SS type A sorting domain-containing protein, partial [Chitinophagaceae bacterium]